MSYWIHPEELKNYEWYKYIRMGDGTFRFISAALNHSDATTPEERNSVRSAGTFAFYPDKIIMKGYGSTTLGVSGNLCVIDEIDLTKIFIRPVKPDW